MFKKFLAVSILAIFLITSLNLVAAELKNKETPIEASNAILKVDNDGDGDYKCIQNAINNANNGDTIEIYSGTYKERIKIKKQIQLIGISNELETGTDTRKPIIDGENKGNVIEIYEDNCTVSGLKIINAGYLKNEGEGLKIISSDNHIIINNTFKNNFIGLMFEQNIKSRFLGQNNFPKNCTIANNIFEYNVFGFYCINPQNHKICNNSFKNSGPCLIGSAEKILSNKYENNTVNNRPIYNYINQENITINPKDAGQILIINCHNCIIENISIHNTTIGIIILYSSNLLIRNNTLRDIHRGGISLYADHCEIYNNSFINCSYGCYLEGGTDFYLHHNNFIKCYKHDQPVHSYIKKHQTFMESKNVIYDCNYWDDWLGLQNPKFKDVPKLIFGFRKYIHKLLNIFPVVNFDRNPVEIPYDL